jgi:tetratricopeptide (TPR) repeat protein
MQRRRREAIASARAIWTEVPAPLMEMMAPATDGISSCKWHALVRFGMWEDILAEPADPEWAKVNHCLRRYARGVALANTGRIEEARSELEAFDQAVEELDGLDRWLGNQPAVEIMPLARLVLEGEIEFKAGDRSRGLDLLRQACEAEEKIVYSEPAPWMMPARHAYGALLIADGRYTDAEAVYLRDLEVYPANGWALLGLRDTLRGQGRNDEAMRMDEAFQRAWRSADVIPPASCYCGTPVATR